MLCDQRRGHVEGDGLVFLRVHDEAAMENLRCSRRAGQQMGEGARGAGFGRHEREFARLRFFDKALRLLFLRPQIRFHDDVIPLKLSASGALALGRRACASWLRTPRRRCKKALVITGKRHLPVTHFCGQRSVVPGTHLQMGASNAAKTGIRE
jgi:hypothetical protein